MKTNRKYYFFVMALFLTLSFFAKNASAIEYGMIGGRPANPDPNVPNNEAWFIYNLEVGQSREDAIEVMNLFEQSFEVMVYAADTVKSSGGGFALKQFSEKNSEVGTWVKFYPDPVPEFFKGVFEKKEKRILEICKMSREDFLLEEEFKKTEIAQEQFRSLEEWCRGKELVERKLGPQERSFVPFVFSVPQNADVGEHTGGILIQKKSSDDVSQGNGSSVKLTTRVGVRIYETVPGEIVKKLSIDMLRVSKHFEEFDFSDWFGKEKKPKEFIVETRVSNLGNVSLEHENNLIIRDLLFKKKNEEIPRKFQALKGDKFVANYSWNKPLFGYYSFQSEIKYNDGNKDVALKSDLVKMLIIPWRELSISAAVLVLAGIGMLIWRKRRKNVYGGDGWVAYRVAKNDTVVKLAQKHKVDWKILAKTNKMKEPFHLAEGQMILVPPSPQAKPLEEVLLPQEPKKRGRKRKSVEMKIESADNFEKFSGPLVIPAEETQPQEEKKSRSYFSVALAKPGGFLSEKKWFMTISAVFLAMLTALAYMVIVLGDIKEELELSRETISSLKQAESRLKSQIEEIKRQPEADKPEGDKAPLEVTHQKAEIKIKVLNGGEKSGSAGDMKSVLLAGGYSKAESANAKKGPYEGVTIYYAQGFAADARLVAEEIAIKGDNIKYVEGIPEGEDPADIIIVMGKV